MNIHEMWSKVKGNCPKKVTFCKNCPEFCCENGTEVSDLIISLQSLLLPIYWSLYDRCNLKIVPPTSAIWPGRDDCACVYLVSMNSYNTCYRSVQAISFSWSVSSQRSDTYIFWVLLSIYPACRFTGPNKIRTYLLWIFFLVDCCCDFHCGVTIKILKWI